MKKTLMLAATVALLSMLSACGQTAIADDCLPETLAVITEPATTTSSTTTTTQASTSTATSSIVVATTVATEPETEPATEPETEAPTDNFELTEEMVVDKMYDFFADKGYTDAQIAGIVGNAQMESGLEPSRSVTGDYFGLFMLCDCPQRQAMFDEMDRQGVGKYTNPEYWGVGESDFDSAEDMEKFLDIMLTYTMNPNDDRWMTELHNAETPEESAEIFLVHYERAYGGSDTIDCYEPYKGLHYQSAEDRREAARSWYEVFSA